MKITKDNKLKAIWSIFFILNLIYIISAYFRLTQIRLLPQSIYEQNIDFNIVFFWPYLFVQTISYSIIKLETDLTFLKRWIVSSLIWGIICFVLFQAFPVALYTTEHFTGFDTTILGSVFYNFRHLTTQLNAFPALFLGLGFITSFLNIFKNNKMGYIYLIIFLFLSLCALFIKQVYLSSIIVSFLLTFILSLISTKFLRS